MKTIIKIAITGGPCGGKTSAMSRLQKYYSESDYCTLFVPESATELITGGITPDSCGLLNYERCEISLQIKKEKLFEFAADTIDAENIIIFCDRGVIDNKAWMTEMEFDLVLGEEKTNETMVLKGYDAVFHLVSAAKGAETFYSLRNNKARHETIEEARALDDRIIKAWSNHPNLFIIDNSTSFNEKMDYLIYEIEAFLSKKKCFSKNSK